ncbi:MAG: DUF1343 domain-containing protein [Ignavibacterium sp.]
MKTLILFLLISIVNNILAQEIKTNSNNILSVKTGIDVLEETNFEILKNKKIGLITNPTGIDNKLKSTVDILNETKVCKLVALFGPEHGVRGDYTAGEYVESYIDEKTKLPVYSLYGKNRKPNKEMLKNIDALVYDIQDIGCRSYTYISTMGLAMEAAAENNIEFIVLDRPNPINGVKVEGNLVEDGFISFVSQFKIPYVYGLTVGELARMLNEEGMLSNGVKCKLTIVPMKYWKREMTFSETGLNWIPTSPHIPYKETPFYYAATGILGELNYFSIGVGYTLPFQILAAEWIDPYKLADKLNSLNLEGVIFRPITFKPFYGKDANKFIKGIQIHITDFTKVNLMNIQFLFLQEYNKLYPDKNPFRTSDTSRFTMFDKVLGTSKIRELFSNRMKYDDIKNYLNKDLNNFIEKSKKYYLY